MNQPYEPRPYLFPKFLKKKKNSINKRKSRLAAKKSEPYRFNDLRERVETAKIAAPRISLKHYRKRQLQTKKSPGKFPIRGKSLTDQSRSSSPISVRDRPFFPRACFRRAVREPFRFWHRSHRDVRLARHHPGR